MGSSGQADGRPDARIVEKASLSQTVPLWNVLTFSLYLCLRLESCFLEDSPSLADAILL